MTMVAVYRGTCLKDAELIAVSSDRVVVGDLVGRMLDTRDRAQDPAVEAVAAGRRKALRIVKAEAER